MPRNEYSFGMHAMWYHLYPLYCIFWLWRLMHQWEAACEHQYKLICVWHSCFALFKVVVNCGANLYPFGLRCFRSSHLLEKSGDSIWGCKIKAAEQNVGVKIPRKVKNISVLVNIARLIDQQTGWSAKIDSDNLIKHESLDLFPLARYEEEVSSDLPRLLL